MALLSALTNFTESFPSSSAAAENSALPLGFSALSYPLRRKGPHSRLQRRGKLYAFFFNNRACLNGSHASGCDAHETLDQTACSDLVLPSGVRGFVEHRRAVVESRHRLQPARHRRRTCSRVPARHATQHLGTYRRLTLC